MFRDRLHDLTIFVVMLCSIWFACTNGPAPNAGEAKMEADHETLFSVLDSAATGIGFRNELVESEQWNILLYEYLYNGGGVATGDINNDGLVDLYFVSNNGADQLYLNQGEFKFKNISTQAGIDRPRGHKTGVTMVDVNGDGLLDIHVCRSGVADPEQRRNLLYINNGDLTFTESARQYGLDDASFSTQAYFFDMDLDGDLDMYLVNHPGSMLEANNINVTQSKDGSLHVKLKDDLTYISDRLYRHDAKGFVDISARAGILNEAFGLSAVIMDANNDGLPDIYVCNDYVKPDQLLIAQKDGTFKDQFDRYFLHSAFSSMGSDLADINNDGEPDLMTVDMTARDRYRYHALAMATNLDKYNTMMTVGLGAQFSANTLQLNNGNGTYSDIAYLAGTAFTDWSWSPLLVDLDNDGWKDAVVSNGYVRDVTNGDYQRYVMDSLRKEVIAGRIGFLQWVTAIPSVKVRSFLFRNQHDLTFADATAEWNSGPAGFSNGAAYADLDNDGYLDLVLNNINDVATVLRNSGKQLAKNHYIRFELIPPEKSTAIGARVGLEQNDGTIQVVDIQPGRGFLSSSESIAHFGIGAANSVRRALITWPDGAKQIIDGPSIDSTHRVTRAPTRDLAKETTPIPYFADLSQLTAALMHAENDYIDFKREPLLHHKLSENGPAAAVADVNGDGRDDIYLGGAKDHTAHLLLQDEKGGFAERPIQAFVADKAMEDVAALFFDADKDGDLDLYVGSGGNERPMSDPAYADRLYLNDGTGRFNRAANALPAAFNSTGCVVASDIDNDGDLDLFVGSRSLPGRYPLEPQSQLLRNDGGRFTDVTAAMAKNLGAVGMIADAVFADLDKDGTEELVLAGEWMPITVFRLKGGVFINVTADLGLAGTTGWWCSLDVADLDGDGFPEIMAGNLGLNTALKTSPAEPVSVHFKDFDGNGTIDPVLCAYSDEQRYPVQFRDRVLDQMIMLKKRFLRYGKYANARLEDVFNAAELRDARVFNANTFAHTLFRNKAGSGFIGTALPNEAQVSMAQAVHFADTDGDGHMDLIVAGNMFGTDTQFGRHDASIGLYMKGDGKGGLRAVPAKESGLLLRGYVRHLVPIRVNGKRCLLVVRNQEKCGLVEMLDAGSAL